MLSMCVQYVHSLCSQVVLCISIPQWSGALFWEHACLPWSYNMTAVTPALATLNQHVSCRVVGKGIRYMCMQRTH